MPWYWNSHGYFPDLEANSDCKIGVFWVSKDGIEFILQDKENKGLLVNTQFLILQNDRVIYKGETDSNGYAEFLDLKIGVYTIVTGKDMKKWANKK